MCNDLVSPLGPVNYLYDKGGRRTQLTAGLQAPVAYTYDNANRMTTLVQGTEIVSFVYDNANRRTKLNLPNGVTQNYAYDNGNQVRAITYTQASGTAIGDLGYAYDLDGQRTAQTGTYPSGTVPIATGFHDVAMMGESVEQGDGHLGIAEHLGRHCQSNFYGAQDD